MSLYDTLASTAKSLLAKFGQQMTLRVVDTGAYDPATGSPAKTETDYTVLGAIFSVNDERVNGSTVLRGDKEATLSAKGMTVTPKANGDLLIVQGERHQIVNVRPLAPAGITVIYQMQVRKAA